jgi:potassium efflux system protein
MESGGESDARELRDANREVGKVFQFIGFLFLIFSFWHIWNDTLTAFKFSQNFALWQDGEQVITVLDVLFALVILYAGYVLHQNLRISLDIYLFGPMGLSEGNRYAITTILRYAILFIAALMAFRQIGLQWSEVQWLAAAFSVGLGFGMQEIFANFISGLIILTERPIRVGDVVSIGDDVWGQVKNIKIRSTTILNWDRQEVIVPNKDLISEKLINWTLSDKTIRVIIKVGVDYKTNIDQAKSIMLDAANAHPRVLSDPEPAAVLLNFGDSSLDLEMDVFISEFKSEDDLDEIKDSLNIEVLQKFRESGIEIPFPQRVLHQTEGNNMIK